MIEPTAGLDPLQPPSFLRSCRSPRSALDRLRFYEAAIRGLTLPAITCRWRSGQNFASRFASDDRFTATNLSPALARPGQERSVTPSIDLTFDRLLDPHTCRKIPGHLTIHSLSAITGLIRRLEWATVHLQLALPILRPYPALQSTSFAIASASVLSALFAAVHFSLVWAESGGSRYESGRDVPEPTQLLLALRHLGRIIDDEDLSAARRYLERSAQGCLVLGYSLQATRRTLQSS